MSRPYRVAYLVSHPIIYQAPLLRYIAAHSDIDLTVMFYSDFGVRAHEDPGFGQIVHWDVPLLDGYKSAFLPTLGRTDHLTSLRPLAYGLTRQFRRERYDALWMHGYAHQVSLRAMAVAKMFGAKVLLRAESQAGSALRRKNSRWLKETALRSLLAQADGCLAIGALNRDYYRHYGVPSDRIFAVPYAVDNEFFQSQAARARPERGALRAALGLEPHRPCILYAAKFQTRKRPGDLLEAYIRLSPDGSREPEPYLLFVGDGEERAALEARAKETGWTSIRFLGFQNQTQLPRFYDLCDLFVLPSEREPWGLTVNEVMNAGKPVIVSDQVGAGCDLVQEGWNGYTVPVGDIDALSDRMGRMTRDPEGMKRMGANSLTRINGWGYREDLQGLEEALERTIRRTDLVGRARPKTASECSTESSTEMSGR